MLVTHLEYDCNQTQLICTLTAALCFAAGSSQLTEAQLEGSLLFNVAALAAEHHAYPQLFRTCRALQAQDPATRARMYQHMQRVPLERGAPPTATFARCALLPLSKRFLPIDCRAWFSFAVIGQSTKTSTACESTFQPDPIQLHSSQTDPLFILSKTIYPFDLSVQA